MLQNREGVGTGGDDEGSLRNARSGVDRRGDPQGRSGDADDSAGRLDVGNAVRISRAPDTESAQSCGERRCRKLGRLALRLLVLAAVFRLDAIGSSTQFALAVAHQNLDLLLHLVQ